MSNDLRVSLTATLADRLTAPMQRMLEEAEKKIGQFTRGLSEAGSTAEATSGKLAAVAGAAGKLAANTGATKLKTDLADAAGASDRVVQNMSRLTTALSKIPALAKGAASALAGIAAAKMVLAEPIQRRDAYELELAKVSNIAYADRDTVKGRQQGQAEMHRAVTTATLQGVSREDALAGLKKLISAGTDRETAFKLLPTIAKFSMAGEASVTDVAEIALKAKQNFGISSEQMPQAMQMALTAGKLGQFEFKDMAHWLPEQMSIAKNMLGMKGLGDLSTLLAANQFAAMAAGNNNQAGNNVVNFLSKINSSDTQNDAKKLGIDLTGTLVKARSEGTTPVYAFLGLLQKTAEGDKQYQRLQERLAKARAAGDKSGAVDTLGAMSDLMMGKNIGKLIQDRQALLGLLGMVNDPKGFKKLDTDIFDSMSKGGVDTDQATLMATAAKQKEQGENAALARQFEALDGLTHAMGASEMQMAKLTAEYPSAAAALEGLKLAAMAAAAALTAVGAVNLLTSAAGGGGIGTGLAALGGAAAARIPQALAVGAAGLVGYSAGTLLYNGALADTKAGDVIGGGIARVLAFFGSDEAKASLESRSKLEEFNQAPPRPAASGAPVRDGQDLARAIDSLATRPLEMRVFLDGREIGAHVEQQISNQARRR